MTQSLKATLDSDWKRLCELSGRADQRLRFRSYFGPRFMPVALIRLSQYFQRKNWKTFAKLFSLFNFMLFKLEVPANLEIGGGLVIPHPQGTVLGAQSIGKNVTIFHQVTIGGKMADFQYDKSLRPKIGDDVTLCVGSKILGPVALGDGCIIGANAVVNVNVEEGATMIGNPARVK